MNHQKTLVRLGALCVAGATAFAGSVSYNFDTDPSGILSLFGGATYSATDGNPAAGGYLSLTDAGNGQRSTIVFDDFDNGLVVKAFSFSMDVRIGGGTTTPADGFSVNYLRSNDPVLTGGDPLHGWAAGINGEADLPEEGSTTGLGIGFDAYDSGSGDVIGISVRVDNVLVAQYPLGAQNTTCGDTNSLQTRSIDPNNAGSPGLLCWQPFSVDLAETGKLIVKYKGREITPAGGLQTTFVPSPGRLVLVARTGALNQNQHIDNLSITTIPSSVPTVSAITSNPAGFDFTILDAGGNKVDSTTVTVGLNGTTVTPVVGKTGDTTSVSYSGFPTLIPAGSTNTITVAYKNNFGTDLSATREYVQLAYEVVTPSYALPAGAVDTAKPGFVLKSYQTAAGNGNSLGLAQDQLAGLLGTNLADLTLAGAGGLFVEPAVINYDKDPATDGKQGNFENELPIPGFPGSGPNLYDNAALEALTYLKFPAAGTYTMGVSSDDGFRVTVAKAAGEKLGGLILGQYNDTGGRGAGVPGTLFTFVVQQAGFYPARLIWQNGGGGSSLEWFSVKTNGSYVLVNDTSDPEAILAYQASSFSPTYVDLVTPNPDKIIDRVTVGPADPIQFELVDGSATTVNAGSIALTVNGSAAAPTVSKVGKRTTLLVSHAFPNLLPAGTTNTITLVYADTATPANVYSNGWSFVVSSYVTLPPGLGSPIGSGDSTKPGFRIKTHQLDIFSPNVGTPGGVQAQNLVAYAEQELLGLFGTNVADLTLADANHYFHDPGVINYTKDTADGTQGHFEEDVLFPGIPGTPQYSSATENFAIEAQTYAEFPAAGLYTLGVDSDDGFAVYPTTAPGPIFALNIGSPAAIAGGLGAISAGSDEGGIGRPLPVVPLTAKLVYADPPLATGPLVNAAAIAGNIALIDRGVNGFSAKLQAAKDAGAIGVVVANNRDTTSADGILPIVMGGTAVDIPAVMITLYDGQKIKAHLADAGGVTVSLGSDPTTRLGFFNGGRGAADGDTLFTFVVPTAGVYPLRGIFFQGGGGGSAEWFSVAADGTRTLLNGTGTGAIKTYQAVTVVAAPTVSVTKTATEVVITFTGALEASDSPGGTYLPVAGATSPLHVPFAAAAAKFYRTRN